MKQLKTFFAVFCTIFLIIPAITAEAADKMQIITTIIPEYDWVLNILGENPAEAELTLLLDNGVDLHSYQPTADDILKISTCDMFIYVGGESDEWVEDALQESVNPEMIVLNLLEMLGDAAKEEEIVEGMQEEEHEHAHGEEEEHEHEHEEETEYDEHVWLSLRNAETLCAGIAEEIAEKDPENAQVYRENASAYIEQLKDLDARYQSAVSEASKNMLLFDDRFPFRYLTDDYGLNYYAAFVGCSAATEASFETVIFLTQKVNELKLNAVMTIEGRDHRIAETIVRSTESKDQKILTMDSMQSVTSKDIRGGANYLLIMESNLEVLKEALQ